MNLTQFLTDNLPQMPPEISAIVIGVLVGFIPALLIVGVVITPVGLFGIWAERRIAGKIQDREGPDRVGIPFLHDKYKWARLMGLGQSMADGLKLLGKEDYVPPGGEKLLFLLAPLVTFGGALGLFAVLPFGPGLQAIDPKTGIFYVLSVGALEVIGVLMAGWASNNKWSLLGAMREVAQVVSYEIPMGIAALCPVLVVGSMQMSEIVARQAANPVIWGIEIPVSGESMLGWNVFAAFPLNLIAFVIFYISSLAALKRAPFDLPECESELVAGFLTEYSGMRWSLFFLGEYAAMFAFAGIGTTLFLGGWSGPLHWLLKDVHFTIPLGFMDLPFSGHVVGGVLAFTIKTTILFLLMIQVRWTLPRLRLDQVMRLCYKYLVPASMVCMMGCGLAALLG